MSVMFLTSTTGGNGMSGLLTEVGTVLTELIGWFGTVISALATEGGELNALFPLLALGIGVSLLYAAVKVVRSFAWGA